MNVDYYALLTRAVAGKDASARDKIYQDAYSLLRKSPLARDAAASHAAALEDAIRRIEDDIAAEAAQSAAVDEVLHRGQHRSWKPIALAACAVIAVAALLLAYPAAKRTGVLDAAKIATPTKVFRTQDETVVADLQAGVDGGSSGESLPFALQRQVVFYRTTIVPGSIVIDREKRFLYVIDGNNAARRYGVGIAHECLKGGSFFRVVSKLEWPAWKTSGAKASDTDELIASAGKPGSLLGARVLQLDKPGLLIHGTNSPKTIGHLVASGCIRLVNDDVEDLYRRVSLDTRVIFVS